MDYIWKWFSSYGLVSTEEKLQKLREMEEENALSSSHDTEKGSFDSADSNSNSSSNSNRSISSKHEDPLRKGSKIKQIRRNEIDKHQGQGCRLIGRSLGIFAMIVAAFIMFIVLQGKHVEVKVNPWIEEGAADNEIEHDYTLPVQCRAPCADSRQKRIAELVLGHTVCPCDDSITETNSTSSANSSNDIDSCTCTPEEMALKWMIEEDNHYTYNELADGVSKTFLMERFVLATFYYTTIGSDHDDDTDNNNNPYKDTNWLPINYYSNGMNGGKENRSASTIAVDHCEWEGVACNNVGVTELSLPDYGLTGTIPKILGALNKLERLHLPRNDFISTIPSQLIVKMKNLIDLDLSGNKVSGTIPTELGAMTNLISIKLGMGDRYGGSHDGDNDAIIGSIPTELGQLKSLEHLSISNTNINGNIPVELGQLTSLKTLSLGMNSIGGSIPKEIETMVQLEILDLPLNNLTGGIPNVIGDFILLQSIDLSYNNLDGVISDADFLPLAPTLRNLNLSYNNLTGVIPLKLGEFKVLEMVDVSSNLFTGEVSGNLGKPPNLTTLNLSDNPLLEGVIPEELCNIRLSRDTFHSLIANCNMCPKEVGDKGCCTSCHN